MSKSEVSRSQRMRRSETAVVKIKISGAGMKAEMQNKREKASCTMPAAERKAAAGRISKREADAAEKPIGR